MKFRGFLWNQMFFMLQYRWKRNIKYILKFPVSSSEALWEESAPAKGDLNELEKRDGRRGKVRREASPAARTCCGEGGSTERALCREHCVPGRGRGEEVNRGMRAGEYCR